MSTRQQIELPRPQPYDFAASVQDHGWIALAPVQWDAGQQQLTRIERLADGTVVLCRIGETAHSSASVLQVALESPRPLTGGETAALADGLSWMLKLNEDLGDFYARAADHHDAVWHTVRGGRGRLLRSPTLWEDVVKTICTTNITWSQTKAMVQRLVHTLGTPYAADPERKAFPTPEQVLAAGEETFTGQVRMGYRNGYVMQLAREITHGDRDLEALRTAHLSQAEMRKELLSIKGIGNYAAHTLLALLGYYGEVGVDSEYRNFVTGVHYGGAETPDKELAHFYDDWDEWKYLAYWFDATQHAENGRGNGQ